MDTLTDIVLDMLKIPGVTQDVIAERSGLSQTFISFVKNGKRVEKPSKSTFESLSNLRLAMEAERIASTNPRRKPSQKAAK